MLVLSRKLGEKVYIGDDVRITVVDIDRGKIRLGIEALRHVPVYREELVPQKAAKAEGADHSALTPEQKQAAAEVRMQEASVAYQAAHKAWQEAIREAEAARKARESAP